MLIIYGFSSIFVTFLCLKFTNLGLFAVAGVSLIGSLVVAICYHLPFSAIYIGLPWYSFFPEVLKGGITMIVQCLFGLFVNFFLPLEESWIMWSIGAIVAGVLGLIANICLILNREEKKALLAKILGKIKKGNQSNDKNINCE